MRLRKVSEGDEMRYHGPRKATDDEKAARLTMVLEGRGTPRNKTERDALAKKRETEAVVSRCNWCGTRTADYEITKYGIECIGCKVTK